MKDILGLGKILQFLNKNYEKAVGAPVMQEVASISKSSQGWQYFVGEIMMNPDRILSSTQAQGKGLELYQEMIDKDPQIASCLRSRKKAVLNKAWDIMPASEKNRDQQIADFVIWAFNYQRRRESWYELMDCIPKGLSVSEILWGWRDEKIVPVDLLGRNPSRFVFDKDYNLRLLTIANPFSGEPLPDRKFLYLRNEPFAENPYGNAALKEIYYYYWFKKNALKWWGIFMEKFGSPTILAKYPATLNTEQKEALSAVFDTLQNATGLRVPVGLDLSFLEAVRRGDAGYLSFIEYCDKMITKSIHGQTLTSGEGDRVGSMALGRVHEDTKYEYTVDDCELLMDGINHQLIPWLVDYNFANVTAYPKLSISYQDEDTSEAVARRDKILISDIGLKVGEDYLYGKYNIPKPQEGDILIEPPQRGGGAFPFSERKKKVLTFAAKGYRIASTLKLRNKYIGEIKKLIASLEDDYLVVIESGKPLGTALEEMMLNKYNSQIGNILDEAQREAIALGAQSMADQLKVTVNKQVFTDLMDDYFKRRTYELGTIEDMGDALKKLFEDKARMLFDQEISAIDVAKQIKKEFPAMADWKANQIAKTEISRAADFAGTAMVKESGLPVEAHFLVDPASCDICQEVASHNPYTLADAEIMGLPHPNCDDLWTFTLKEE